MVENYIDDSDDEDDMEQPQDTEIYRAIPIITGLFYLFNEARQEVIDNAGIKVLHSYPKVNALAIELEVHALNHVAYTRYSSTKTQLNERYGDIDERSYLMKPDEAMQRWKNLLLLAKAIGLMQIDPRRAYSEPRKEDDIEFSGWDEE
jgi:hypothetical protein